MQRRHGAAADAEKRLRAVGEAFKKAQAGVQFADAWHELARALMDQDKFTDALSALGETLEVRRVARDRFGLCGCGGVGCWNLTRPVKRDEWLVEGAGERDARRDRKRFILQQP